MSKRTSEDDVPPGKKQKTSNENDEERRILIIGDEGEDPDAAKVDMRVIDCCEDADVIPPEEPKENASPQAPQEADAIPPPEPKENASLASPQEEPDSTSTVQLPFGVTFQYKNVVRIQSENENQVKFNVATEDGVQIRMIGLKNGWNSIGFGAGAENKEMWIRFRRMKQASQLQLEEGETIAVDMTIRNGLVVFTVAKVRGGGGDENVKDMKSGSDEDDDYEGDDQDDLDENDSEVGDYEDDQDDSDEVFGSDDDEEDQDENDSDEDLEENDSEELSDDDLYD